MEKVKLIYISSLYTGLVIESQVYKLLDYYQKTNWFSDIVLVQQYMKPQDRELASEMLKDHTFKYFFFRASALYPILYDISRRNLEKVLLPELSVNPFVIHTRDAILSSLALGILEKYHKPLCVLNEFRGAFIQEFESFGTTPIGKIKNFIRIPYANRKRQLLFANKYVHHTGISPKMRDLAISEGINPSLIDLHPNIAASIFEFKQEWRNEIRQLYGIPKNQPVIVLSSGEGGSWQKDQDYIDTLLLKGFVVLNMSKNKVEKENVINVFVPHNEMPKYLSAGDAALLWREDIILNNVACPSKFGEFAIMGLYLIHNGSVDIATRFIESHNCGKIVNSFDDIELTMIEIEDSDERKRRCRCGYEFFSVEAVSKSYYENYKIIISKAQ